MLLGALERHDQRRGGELVHTLAVFLRSSGGLSETASVLGVHRNTVSYRVNRIAELSGRDLGDPRARLLFEVALAIRDIERAKQDISASASAGR